MLNVKGYSLKVQGSRVQRFEGSKVQKVFSRVFKGFEKVLKRFSKGRVEGLQRYSVTGLKVFRFKG